MPEADAPARLRDRSATEDRLLAAVGSLLARDGVAGLGVNAVAREAAVDKVLIYRYFGGLPGLLTAWGRSGRFWPSVADLLAAQPGLLQAPLAERYAAFFEHFIDALRARPVTLAVLAGEITQRNELTVVLEAEREAWGDEAFRVLGGAELAQRPHLRATTLLLVAGVQYLMLRGRSGVRLFGGVDLQDDAGWQEIKAVVRGLAQQLLR